MQTDEFIQKSLRQDFAATTVITVAHRLNTIIDYDCIAVFEAGEIVEYGSPKHLLSYVLIVINLYRIPDGRFAALVAETGVENEALLHSLAR